MNNTYSNKKLFTESGLNDLKMLASILNDTINNTCEDKDFSFMEYVEFISGKYGLDLKLIEGLGIIIYLNMDEKGLFHE